MGHPCTIFAIVLLNEPSSNKCRFRTSVMINTRTDLQKCFDVTSIFLYSTFLLTRSASTAFTTLHRWQPTNPTLHTVRVSTFQRSRCAPSFIVSSSRNVLCGFCIVQRVRLLQKALWSVEDVPHQQQSTIHGKTGNVCVCVCRGLIITASLINVRGTNERYSAALFSLYIHVLFV